MAGQTGPCSGQQGLFETTNKELEYDGRGAGEIMGQQAEQTPSTKSRYFQHRYQRQARRRWLPSMSLKGKKDPVLSSGSCNADEDAQIAVKDISEWKGQGTRLES